MFLYNSHIIAVVLPLGNKCCDIIHWQKAVQMKSKDFQQCLYQMCDLMRWKKTPVYGDIGEPAHQVCSVHSLVVCFHSLDTHLSYSFLKNHSHLILHWQFQHLKSWICEWCFENGKTLIYICFYLKVELQVNCQIHIRLILPASTCHLLSLPI